MIALKLALAGLSLVVIVQTALSFVRSRAWWVRIFDFPRAQIAALSALLLVLFGLSNIGFEDAEPWEWLLFALLGLAVAIQVGQMLPYTRCWRYQSPKAQPSSADAPRLRVVISNVCMQNRAFDRWLEVMREPDPDLIIAVEIDRSWVDALKPLHTDYPHRILCPQDNTYGVALYSRFPLESSKIEHLIEDDVPSVFTTLMLPSGDRVRCVVLHPRPPRPDIRQDSDFRDAELVRAAQIVRDFRSPFIVAGDLNDVAWSHTTHLFQRIVGALDPRIGRGIFATFHTHHRWMRYPLDHLFHSEHFAVAQLQRLPDVGSDHFPIFIELVLQPETAKEAPTPQSDPSDEEQAVEAVQDAVEHRESETPAERHDRKSADR